MKKIKIYIGFFLLLFMFSSCEYDLLLGKGLQLWGDNEKYYTIVYCWHRDILGICVSGLKIIPPSSKIEKIGTAIYGLDSEHVEKYKNDRNWLLVKTNYTKYGERDWRIQRPIDTTYKRYWVIDKSYNEKIVDVNTIISSYLVGPLDSIAFYDFLKDKDLVSLWEK